MSFDEDLVRLIDQRIRAHQQQTAAVGTCVNRDTTGPVGYVLFDGATVAVPVKVAGGVVLQPGMRCLLNKYGTEWVVTEAFGAPALGFANAFVFGPAVAATTTSSTFVDITGMDAFTFTKYQDLSWCRVFYSASCTTTGTAPVEVRWGLRFTQVSGSTAYTPVDYSGPHFHHNTIGEHNSNGVQFLIGGVGIALGAPAGTYSCTLRWRRTQGTGTLTCDNNDVFSVTVEEFVNPSYVNL